MTIAENFFKQEATEKIYQTITEAHLDLFAISDKAESLAVKIFKRYRQTDESDLQYYYVGYRDKPIETKVFYLMEDDSIITWEPDTYIFDGMTKSDVLPANDEEGKWCDVLEEFFPDEYDGYIESL